MRAVLARPGKPAGSERKPLRFSVCAWRDDVIEGTIIGPRCARSETCVTCGILPVYSFRKRETFYTSVIPQAARLPSYSA